MVEVHNQIPVGFVLLLPKAQPLGQRGRVGTLATATLALLGTGWLG